MTVFEKMRGVQIPDYSPTMWMGGYEPWQILEAGHKSMIENAEADAPANVNVNVEVSHK